MGSSGGQYKGSQDRRNTRKKRQRRKRRRRRNRKRKTVEVRKVVEEWEIWDEEEEAAKSEEEAKKLVLKKFHRWIKVFGKKQLERMSTRKLWNHAIDVKKGFIAMKRESYSLLREEREEVREF